LGDHILLAPSYISTEAEIDLIVETLADAVNDVIEGLNGS
jgi:adenosylmethionine-8-amino-7-oxononanoate aminotransferase